MICPCGEEINVKNVFGIKFYIHKKTKEECNYLNSYINIEELFGEMFVNNNDDKIMKYMFLDFNNVQHSIMTEFVDIKNIDDLKAKFFEYKDFIYEMTGTMINCFGETFVDNCKFLKIKYNFLCNGGYGANDMLNIKEEIGKIKLKEARENIKKKYGKKFDTNIDQTTIFVYEKGSNDNGYFKDNQGNIIKENEFNALSQALDLDNMKGEAFKHLIRNIQGMRIAKDKYDSEHSHGFEEINDEDDRMQDAIRYFSDMMTTEKVANSNWSEGKWICKDEASDSERINKIMNAVGIKSGSGAYYKILDVVTELKDEIQNIITERLTDRNGTRIIFELTSNRAKVIEIVDELTWNNLGNNLEKAIENMGKSMKANDINKQLSKISSMFEDEYIADKIFPQTNSLPAFATHNDPIEIKERKKEKKKQNTNNTRKFIESKSKKKWR